MQGKAWQTVVIIAVSLVVGALAAWLSIHYGVFKPRVQPQALPAVEQLATPTPEEVIALPSMPTTEPATTPAAQAASAPASAPASMPASGPGTGPAEGNLNAQQAMTELNRGLELLKANNVIEARTALSSALLGGPLDAQHELQALAELEKLAQQTIFSDSVVQDDPYTYYHVIESGDVLVRLERRETLHIPCQLILKVNHLSRAEDIRSGQRIKLIRGPFHATISKSRFTMDIFLQREGLPRVWVARLKCGLGKGGSTPLGMWKVGKDFINGKVIPGGKLERPTWNPPPSSELSGPIKYGEQGYALGDKGLWVGLVGIDDNTRNKTDYGIHSTTDQSSIGKEESLGCIRLADKDIELVYSLLYEVWSSVQTNP